MSRWKSWFLVVGVAALGFACDGGGGPKGQGGALEAEEDVLEDDLFEAPEACVPQCGAAVCGDDGCGGTCGTCGADETCADGACVSECAACMESGCAWELSRCDANWECPALMQCLSGCGSDSCMESCLYSYYGGADDLLDLLECVDDECSWEC
jgi:hypothetical protein